MRSLELKVGALILVSLALLAGFVVLLGNFSLRGGYLMTAAGGAAPSIAGGFGLKVGSYLIDASVVPTGSLGMATKLNLTMRFGRNPDVRPTRRPEEEMNGVYSLGI